VEKTLKRKSNVARRGSNDKTDRTSKTGRKPKREVNLEKIDELTSQPNLKTAPERDNISVGTFIIEPPKKTESSSKTCSIM
jgi:hypothetical protein